MEELIKKMMREVAIEYFVADLGDPSLEKYVNSIYTKYQDEVNQHIEDGGL